VPGLLGALDVFERDFAEPIKAGGYTNATAFVVFRAYTAAVNLRDLIKPFLLRRLKKDVQANLPSKTEQIFFVKLTSIQERAYRDFLESGLCRSILDGSAEAFVGIDHLRKICNHPALLEDSAGLGVPEHSSKLNLLAKVLPQWQRRGHRALLFSQSLRMLTYIEGLLGRLELTFFRIDGKTGTTHRQTYIDQFNAGERFCCLLSTHVGGVGVNLTGADRVIIIDPDWNPSTDNQALERAFRIGQTKDVSVYRLITLGTIEEKIYKKQIFKQFLSNKILQSPNQKRMFKPQTLRELFRLDDQADAELATDDDDDEGEVDHPDGQNDDKELMQSLCEDGDIQHVFRHDSLFTDDRLPERELTKSQARSASFEAAQRLKHSTGGLSSVQLISRIRDHSDSEAVSQNLSRKVLDLLRPRDGHATTSEIVAAFKHDREASSNIALLKQILRRVAVLNKKTHIWHLMGRFRDDRLL
jgi:DNA excision repair protein ERCC-6